MLKLKLRDSFILPLSVISSLLFFSCGSSNVVSERPLWANVDTLDAAYPKASYIARTSSGESAAAALALAESELVSHFAHTIVVNTNASDTKSMTNGAYSSKQEINKEVNIRSAMELFAVRKTNPWYDKANRLYYACAYIDRAEAWSLYRPHVVSSQQSFLSYYDKADKESDAFKKIKILHACEESAETFASDLEFVRMLSPSALEEFASGRKKLAAMNEQMSSARLAASMKVSVKDDEGNRISRTVSGLLSGEGYYLSDRDYAYQVNVVVEKNFEKHKDGEDTIIVSEPGLTITVSNGSEKLFSYNKSFPRISGFSEAFVNKKLYAALESELNESFVKEFKAALE
ncbi:MAG: hypothetical protein IJ727_03980 [Treponema sp.]|nr:hypothetical protein [Treponema sp.]